MASCKRKRTSGRYSAEIIACNDDLLVQIFLRLPAKTVLRLRIINKHWHSLILSPEFCRLHSDHNFKYKPSGLLLNEPSGSGTNFSKSIIFNFDGYPMPRCRSIFPPKYRGNFLESCNGLFLYCYEPCFKYQDFSSYLRLPAMEFFIGNPTTKQSALLPKPEGIQKEPCFCLSLAFDPSLSPHYKVVYLWWSKSSKKFFSRVFSSETGCWKASGHVASANDCCPYYFGPGVYCNGAIYWKHGRFDWDHLIHYNIKEDCLNLIKFPSRHINYTRLVEDSYLAAVKNKLIVIDIINVHNLEMILYELDNDSWILIQKYRISGDQVLKSVPNMIDDSTSFYYCVGAFEGVEKEDIVILIPISRVVIAHHTKDGSTRVFLELPNKWRRWSAKNCRVYNYFESLCCV